MDIVNTSVKFLISLVGGIIIGVGLAGIPTLILYATVLKLIVPATKAEKKFKQMSKGYRASSSVTIQRTRWNLAIIIVLVFWIPWNWGYLAADIDVPEHLGFIITPFGFFFTNDFIR